MKLFSSTITCTGLASVVLASLGGGRHLAFGFSISPSSTLPDVAAATSSTRLDMAVWSDMKAVRDYQDFLASGKQELEHLPDGPSVIVRPTQGSEELAEALHIMGMGDDAVLYPNEALPPGEYPIYITLPPTQIESFIQNLPDEYKDRNQDFVFFSGGLEFGNIEDILKDYGYCRDSMTQVLISGMKVVPGPGGGKVMKDLAVNLGVDNVGENKWAGQCAACGKWSGAIAQRMEKNNVRCEMDFYRDWRRKMWERNILDGVFHLVGALREERTTVQDVANYYGPEVSDMAWEISSSLRGWKAITLTFGFEERLFGTAEVIGSEMPCTLVEEMYPFIWGNRVFIDSPLFVEYLWYARDQFGMLPSVELPPKKGDGEATGRTIMRQGNLRADGVV